jgi:hypothetical protein
MRRTTRDGDGDQGRRRPGAAVTATSEGESEEEGEVGSENGREDGMTADGTKADGTTADDGRERSTGGGRRGRGRYAMEGQDDRDEGRGMTVRGRATGDVRRRASATRVMGGRRRRGQRCRVRRRRIRRGRGSAGAARRGGERTRWERERTPRKGDEGEGLRGGGGDAEVGSVSGDGRSFTTFRSCWKGDQRRRRRGKVLLYS